MLTIKLAKLHLFQTTGGIAFLFGRRIVAPFALGAFQNNQFAHCIKLSLVVDDIPEPSERRPGNSTAWQICRIFMQQSLHKPGYQSMISETRPEATVRPPSRIAKRRPFSIAMGAISSTVMAVLSPGITISVPSARVMEPVTSVVRKKN